MDFADYIADNYVVNPLKSFLNVAFPNAGYTQPAFESQPERRVNYARRATSLTADETSDLRCVFTGEPVSAEWLSASELSDKDKSTYPSGRAFRHNIPMLIGENMINFHAGGDPGLPVSGKAMLCLQAMPMGCAKVGGRLLAVHSDNPAITFKFASRFLNANLQAVVAARQADSSKLAEMGSAPKTVLIETLLDIEEARLTARDTDQAFSVTAYHLSNSGQSNPLDARSPPLEIHTMPFELIGFLGATRNARYKDAWNAICMRAWVLAKPRKSKKETTADTDDGKKPPHRNFLYEDLFSLPHNAGAFVRTYLLRVPRRTAFDEDPRRGYALRDEASLVSWSISELFLSQVLHMNERRINTIRDMADRLADYIHTENDKTFFTRFYSATYYEQLRNQIIKVSEALLKRGQPPLVEFDSYVAVFEEPSFDQELKQSRNTWRLARDLMLIRMIERLYQLKWLQTNLDAIPEVTAAEAESE
jgi:CRISPR-associated protein Cst1